MKTNILKQTASIYRISFVLLLGWSILLVCRKSPPQHVDTWLRLSTIQVKSQPLADSLQALLAAGASFQELAQRYSTHSSAAQGGLLGWVKLSALHGEVKEALLQTEDRGISPVISLEDNYFIYLKEESDPAQRTPHWHEIKAQIDALRNTVDSLSNAGEHAQALAKIAEGEKLSVALQEFESTSALMYHKGNIMLREGNSPAAFESFSQLIDFSSAFGMNEWWSNGAGGVGRVIFSSGLNEEAIQYLEKALNIARASDYQRGESNWLGSLGMTYNALQQLDRAQEYLTQALAKAKASNDTWGEGLWWSLLGQVYQNQGNLSMTVTCFDSALVLARKNQDKKALAQAFGTLGSTYFGSGEFLQAASAFDSALSLTQALGDRQNESYYLGTLGKLYAELGHYDRATSYYERAMKLSQQLGNDAKVAGWQGELGKVYVARGDYREAIRNFERALAITRDVADRYYELHWIEQLGATFQTMGDYEKAISYFASGLQLARQITDPTQEILMLSRLGRCSSATGKRNQAIDFFRQCADLAHTTAVKSDEILALHSIGFEYSLLGDLPKAMPYFENARKIAQDIGNPALQIMTTNSLSDAFNNLGEYEKAISTTAEAIAYARANNYIIEEAYLLSAQGMYYVQLGDYSRAISAYASALGIYQTIARPDGQARCWEGLGTAYGVLGQWQYSRAFYDSALVKFQAIGNKFDAAVCLSLVASADLWLGQYQEAVSGLNEAILMLNQMGDPSIVSKLLRKMGLAYALQGDMVRASDFLDKAISRARELGNQTDEAASMGALGDLLRVQGKFDQSRHYSAAALSLAEKINDRESVWKLHRSLAKTYLAMRPQKAENAFQHFEKAMTIIESLGQEISQDPLKLPFLEDRQSLYRDYVEALLSRNGQRFQEQALQIAERARARAFAELIARRFYGHAAEQENNLLAPASFQQIRGTAQRLNASVLEYFVSESKLVIWLITSNGQLHTTSVPINTVAFDSLLDRCHLGFTQEKPSKLGIQAPDFLGRNVRVLDSPTNIDYKPYLTQLYQLLFPKEIQAHLPQQPGARLLLVPHRKLSVILILGLQDSSGHYLLEKYSAHQVPGIGVLLQTDAIQKARGTRNKSYSTDMLLFGNPAMPKWGNGLLSQLAGAEKEVKAISRKLRTSYQIGVTASEAAFKTQATNKRLIHLATHGISFDASPLESFIALAPGNGENGQLTAAEILEMKFNADLVVLSACETGLGKISGDGVEGLLRSFMASGVPSVLVSLWKVDDEATRELMLAFYDNLNKGLDKAEALRQAQLKIMVIPKWSHPKFWAAFVLYGER